LEDAFRYICDKNMCRFFSKSTLEKTLRKSIEYVSSQEVLGKSSVGYVEHSDTKSRKEFFTEILFFIQDLLQKGTIHVKGISVP